MSGNPTLAYTRRPTPPAAFRRVTVARARRETGFPGTARTAARLLGLALALAGCGDAFGPIAEDGPAFAVHGALDGRASTQRLRVQDLRGSLVETPDRLPATVTSTELGSGARTAWRDSLVTLADGTRGHVFVADLEVRAGEAHRVEAVHDDGRASTVAVALPAPTAVAGDASPTPSAAVRVDVDGLGGLTADAVVRYRVRRADGTGDTSFTAPIALESTGRGATFLTFLGPAEQRASQILYGTSTADPVFLEASLEAVVREAEPAPVQNGAGAVGWVLDVSVPIPVTAASLTQVGFIDGRAGS